jgi:acyl-[acyl-carrier-protein]-phospholipid O-acyltransferase / long-chain-fatty-acid--[acyl-carrier-protein] ligase
MEDPMNTARAGTGASSTAAGLRGFWFLNFTQLLGAFNDMAYQTLVRLLILALVVDALARDRMVLYTGALFALPFILFSMTGGWLADRFSKRSVTIGTKALEIAVMALGAVALARGELGLALVALALLGTQSALFGPSKYGLLPELLPPKRLSWGNGVLGLMTFLGIILGTQAGAWMSDAFRGRHEISGGVLLALAVAGLVMAAGITRVPAADPARPYRVNFIADLFTQLRRIRAERVLWLAVLGYVYFYFLGALLQINILYYGKDVLAVSDTAIGHLLVAIAVGIGLGSLAAGQLSGNKIEYGLIPLGAVGMTVFAVLLGGEGLSFGRVAAYLSALGFFAGFFIVPISALVQHRPEPERKGGVLAAANLLSFVGIFLAAGVFFGMRLLGLEPGAVFFWSGVLTIAGTVYVVRLLPDSLARLLLWMLTHSLYRIRVVGRDNVPDKGGALFVSNHLSIIDGLLLIASVDRPVRMIMLKEYYEKAWINPVAKILGIIPISSLQRPRELLKSLRTAAAAIEAGEVVCIFAEGQITRIGQLLPFRRGFEKIMKGLDAPIIPVAMDGLWGSLFSFESGRFLWKMPRRIPYPVTVHFGAALPATATATEVRQAVQELMSEAYAGRRERMRTLGRRFVSLARRRPWRFAMADARVPRLRMGMALLRAIYLARRLAPHWRGQKMVGVLLPPSVGGALVNFAAVLTGRVPVNLNYTASNETIASCAQQCELETVVTSQTFLERVRLEVPGRTLLLEDVAGKPRATEMLAALLMRWFFPVRLLERALGQKQTTSLDDLATVIFSSGSTGDPKGVMLSHYNIGSNIDQLQQTFALTSRDRILGILPFFHSFGFTGTLWLPAATGIGVVFHPSPIDAGAIGELVRKYKVTMLLATPTFLQTYTRRCEPGDFGSLEIVLAGAEKLNERVARAFEERFGVRPLEGYGCTECAPAVTVNTRDFRAAGYRQVGAKPGRIGHPLPGVSVRIVDPDTFSPVPLGQPGLMLVRGPNVMQGYLGKPEKTAEVLRDGWYVTGDIAAMDEDGFLTITDRLSRFSKIGGEMVPHIKVEETLHEVAGATEQTFVVTGIPDARKGERLVVLHTLAEEKLKECLEKLGSAGLPNLWVPRPNHFFRVEKLPYLGTGKLDLRRIRDLAMELAPAAEA